MIRIVLIIQFIFGAFLISNAQELPSNRTKIPVIFDTDANNELDDQHALAYLLCNGNYFNVLGITVNATKNGGDIDQHYVEADRILKLFDLQKQVPLIKGANGDFNSIKETLKNPIYDGVEAVQFIINKAKKHKQNDLVLIAVGKLTNIALALMKDPSIADNIRLVWLGSNYPEPGEYNLENDISAMNFLLQSDIRFEIVMVRYGKTTGTDAVRVTPVEINEKMKGLGLKTNSPVIGRHGEAFDNFGDYSINLFENAEYYGNPPSRALFDMAAVAIVKNPNWAESKLVQHSKYINGQWVVQNGSRKIKVWENFNRDEIISDFYTSLKNFVLVK